MFNIVIDGLSLALKVQEQTDHEVECTSDLNKFIKMTKISNKIDSVT